MDEAEFIRQLAQLRLQYGEHQDSKRGRGQHPARGHQHGKGHGLTNGQMDAAIKSRMAKPMFSNTRIFVLMVTISVALMSAGFSFVMSTPNMADLQVGDDVSEQDVSMTLREQLKDYVLNTQCVLEANQFVSEIGRPIYNCSLCKDMKEIRRVSKMTREEFTKHHAYSTIPVVITGETDNWGAMNHFSYDYFKKLYNTRPDQMDDVNESCGYFAWNSDVPSLGHVFNMSDARAKLAPGEKPWYIGWANCHQETSIKLREMYSKPSFLPEDSESSTLDWIFMGYPGMGAFIHLDSVIRPSWQAQISGRKTWTFDSVPECRGICQTRFTVTVEKGEIIVFDSNQWYHGTHTEPGDISITIGSEYD